MDPLDYTVTEVSRLPLAEYGLNSDSKIRVSALITPEMVGALRAHRTSRRLAPANTEIMIGELLAEILSKYTPNLPLAKSLETNATKAVRWALAEETVRSNIALTRALIQYHARVALPTVALAVKALVRMGLAESSLGRTQGRPVEVFRLTPRGIKISAEDHPDASIRFALGGMLPEELDPLAPVEAPEPAPAILEAFSPGGAQVNFWKQALARVAKSAKSDEDPDGD
jgi:hypothetical protein